MARATKFSTIKRMYPNVIAEDSRAFTPPTPEYCVLGAAALYAGKSHLRFPDEDGGRDVLTTLNPRLPPTKAERLAETIINYNDSHRFSRAWRTLKRALSFGYVPRSGRKS